MGLGLLLFLALAAFMASTAAAATTVTVNTTADETAANGTCSLREATLYANGTAEPDCALTPPSGTTAIVVPAGTFALAGLPLTLTGNASISGAGAAATTVTGGGQSQVLLVKPGATASVSGLTVTGGQSPSVCTNPLCVGARLPSSGLPGGGIANDGTLTLTGVTVSGNRTGAGTLNGACTPPNPAAPCSGGFGGDGGGISNSRTGTLTIVASTISGNTTGTGAAGQPGPPNDTPGGSGNAGHGGGISNAGTLTIKNSTIAGNTTAAGPDGAPGAVSNTGRAGNASGAGAGGSGGGIESSGPLFISGTTLVGNQTGAGGRGGLGGNGTGPDGGGLGTAGGPGGSGGAIDSTADMTISNSTFVANSAAGGGAAGANGTPSGPGGPGPGVPGTGGAINERAMGSTLTHVTITANSAGGVGGGVDGAGGTVTIGNSIVAGNVAAAPNLNCAGVLVDQGGNIEFAASSCPAGFLQANPKLTGLADNGGPTQTIALQPGSAAIHHVPTCVLGTDQRGVARPVGAPCDSGAYQVAPPSVSGVSVSAITTTTAAIAASVNPNLRDTTVVVDFGLTPSYGSSTPPQDLGAGNAPASFAAALSGLRPNTTYHFAVVATNADGQTKTSDGVFTTLPPLTASIAQASTLGPALQLTIACGGGFGPGTCNGAIELTTRGPGKHRHSVKVAAGSYSVHSGSRTTVRIALNRTGRTMLTQQYVLATTMSVRGTTPVTRKVTFKYPVITSKTPFTLGFAPGSTTFTQLSVPHVPRGGKVTVICHGGGCPFSVRAFTPHHGHVSLAPFFKHSALRPGATLQLRITAPNRVGEIETFVVRGGQKPLVTHQCLPPGAARPGRCVK
ncbi:MAG TPA: choice-of-anchor Q domain-containing protein [Solirubrobacteraceae bacterium]|nr:choice-of-anchor Q domain-containing protein [Solirubrobacteraceae bacterium]